MNNGILTSGYQPAQMPYGLLGNPTPVPMIDARRVFDPDAARYLAAVEAADSRPLEEAVRIAVAQFVIGCKEDGIWSAIKASCLLMGARTLAGALTPLVGAAPTNNNFVSGDYDRKTGLVGNGTNKRLLSNRAGNADPLNNVHLSVYASAAQTPGSGVFPFYIGYDSAGSGLHIGRSQNNGPVFFRSRADPVATRSPGAATGLIGQSRARSDAYVSRLDGSSRTEIGLSAATAANNITVFSSASSSYSNGRLAFYSIGESIDLALLDSRVSTLYTAIGSAIP